MSEPLAMTGRLATLSAGKDTTVGHWEHMGLVTARPFPTYPDGFPEEVLGPFREQIGRGVLGNKPASGTAIIDELGAAHLASGEPIVYTSADSVFQIAAHVGVGPAGDSSTNGAGSPGRSCRDRHGVARVIARPFTGTPGAFVRTKDRRDFSLAPPGPTYLDLLATAGVPVLALGKISEVFVGRGVTAEIKVASNDENLAMVRDLLQRRSDQGRFDEGLLFTNLVDFDMVWGHRNDVDGFAAGLAAVDAVLPGIIASLDPGDMLLITADHGVDPTTVSTDHSREYVPLLLYPRPAGCPAAVYEGTLADTGATIYASLTGKAPPLGGDVLAAFRPRRGWRPHTPAQPVRRASRGVATRPCGPGRGRASGDVPSASTSAHRRRRRWSWARVWLPPWRRPGRSRYRTAISPSGGREKCPDIPTGWRWPAGARAACCLAGGEDPRLRGIRPERAAAGHGDARPLGSRKGPADQFVRGGSGRPCEPETS